MKKELHKAIFPNLLGPWAEVNLNQLAKQFVTDASTGIVTVEQQVELMNELHRSLGVHYSYGGWMEDRSVLWKGHYMTPDKMTHLGIDYNVPAATPVYLPWAGEAVFCTHDKDQNGGWGGRVDFYNAEKKFYFIFGHLDQVAEVIPLRKPVLAGMLLGYQGARVGNSDVNGGWFPHLHLQVVSKVEYERQNPMDIDGYGLPNLDKEYPDPEKV